MRAQLSNSESEFDRLRSDLAAMRVAGEAHSDYAVQAQVRFSEQTEQAGTMVNMLESMKSDLARTRAELDTKSTVDVHLRAELEKERLSLVECSERLARVEQSLEYKIEELDNSRAENAKLQSESAARLMELDARGTEVSGLKQRLRAASAESTQMHERLQAVNDELSKLRGDLCTSARDISKLRGEAAAQRSDGDIRNERMLALEDRLRDKTQEADNLKKDCVTLRLEYARASADFEAKCGEASRIRAELSNEKAFAAGERDKLSAVQERLEILQREGNARTMQHDNVTAGTKRLEADLAARSAEAAARSEEVACMEPRLRAATVESVHANQRLESVTAEVTQLRGQVDAGEAEKARLRSELAALEQRAQFACNNSARWKSVYSKSPKRAMLCGTRVSQPRQSWHSCVSTWKRRAVRPAVYKRSWKVKRLP